MNVRQLKAAVKEKHLNPDKLKCILRVIGANVSIKGLDKLQNSVVNSKPTVVCCQ